MITADDLEWLSKVISGLQTCRSTKFSVYHLWSVHHLRKAGGRPTAGGFACVACGRICADSVIRYWTNLSCILAYTKWLLYCIVLLYCFSDWSPLTPPNSSSSVTRDSSCRRLSPSSISIYSCNKFRLTNRNESTWS